jgi:hypothetical protein
MQRNIITTGCDQFAAFTDLNRVQHQRTVLVAGGRNTRRPIAASIDLKQQAALQYVVTGLCTTWTYPPPPPGKMQALQHQMLHPKLYSNIVKHSQT